MLVGRRAAADTLLVVNFENGGKQRIVFSQNESVIEVLQNFPSGFIDLVAREYHVHSVFDRIRNLDRQNARVSVQILCFAFKAIESVRVLQLYCRKTFHEFSPVFLYLRKGGISAGIIFITI